VKSNPPQAEQSPTEDADMSSASASSSTPAGSGQTSSTPSAFQQTPPVSQTQALEAMEKELAEERRRRVQLEEDMRTMREQVKLLSENRASSKSVSFGTSSFSPKPLRSIEEDPLEPARARGKETAATPNPGDDGGDDDGSDPGRRRDYRTPRREDLHRDSSLSGISTMSYATRIQKIPNLPTKLSDGIDYSPRLWEVQVRNALNRYANYFMDEDHKKDWLLNQTSGMAQTFLEPAFLEPEFNEDGDPIDVLDLVEQLVSFLSNPHDKQTARSDYSALVMSPAASFWTFYHSFRTLARKAGISDKSVLKMDLQEKIPGRLRKKLYQEYRTSRTLEDYVEAIQAEDQGQFVERTYFASSESSVSKSSSRRPIKTSMKTETALHPSQAGPSKSFGAEDRRPTSRLPTPNLPARTDTPRAQTPAIVPRHYSSQPTQRQNTSYRVNEIDAGQPSESDSDEDNEEVYVDAAEELSTSPRVKGQT
jgi:hypothetical protein